MTVTALTVTLALEAHVRILASVVALSLSGSWQRVTATAVT